MLTPEMKIFAQKWINTKDEYKSALFAGVPKEFASKLSKDWLANKEVQEYINQEIERTIEKVKLTRDWVVKEAIKTYQISEKIPDKKDMLRLLNDLCTKLEEKDGSEEASAKIIINTNGTNISITGEKPVE